MKCGWGIPLIAAVAAPVLLFALAAACLPEWGSETAGSGMAEKKQDLVYHDIDSVGRASRSFQQHSGPAGGPRSEPGKATPKPDWIRGLLTPRAALAQAAKPGNSTPVPAQGWLSRHWEEVAGLTLTGVLMAAWLLLKRRTHGAAPRELLHFIRGSHQGDTTAKARGSKLTNAFDALSSSCNKAVDSLEGKLKDMVQPQGRYKDFFVHAVEGFYRISPNGRFILANDSLLRLLGFSGLDELQGAVRNAPAQCLQDRGDARELAERLRRDGRVADFEAIVLRRDKTGFWGNLNIHTVLDEEGRVRFYEGSLVDGSERREKEHCKRESELASARDRAKTQFLASMSHEIRTPLQSMLGLTQLALSTGREDLRQNYLMAIGKAGQQLSLLAENILDYAVIESGGVRLNETDFLLRRLLMGVIEGVSDQAEEKGLRLNLTMAPGMPEWVRGDAARLRQILENLVDNAVKFTPSGQIVVQARQIEVDEEDGDALRVLVSVSDTGIGILPEKEAAIFDPFCQADQSFRRSYGGIGLGLAISKRLAAAMGGDLHVQSSPGKGSVFTLEARLRQVRKPSDDPAPVTADRAEAGSLRLLLVEDNTTNAFFMKELLRSLKHEVIVASSGREALEILSRVGVDSVLMDVEMPEMDGMETSRRIREGGAGSSMADVPILAVSAHGLDSVREQCLDSGMNAFLTKPIDARLLIKTLGELAERRTDWCVLPPMEEREGASFEPGDLPGMTREAYFERMKELFEESVSTAITRIGESLIKQDAAEVAHQAHVIVNSAVVAGADELAEMSRRIESGALAGDLKVVEAEYQSLLAFNPSEFKIALRSDGLRE